MSPPSPALASTLPTDLGDSTFTRGFPRGCVCGKEPDQEIPRAQSTRENGPQARPGKVRPKELDMEARAPAAPRAGEWGVPATPQASPTGTVLVCLCMAGT